MSESETNCKRCGHPNPIYGIWCDNCGGTLPAGKPLSAQENEQALAKRDSLYQQVLQDLDGLHQQHDVSVDTYDSIQTFYSHQLDTIKRQQQQQETVRSHYKLLLTARHAAQGGTYSDAIEILGKLRQCDQYGDAAQGLIAEVQQKQVAQQQAALAREAERLDREIMSLHDDAKHLIELGKYPDAKAKLSRAIKLSPDNMLLSQTADDLDERIERARTEERSRVARDAEVVRQESDLNRQKQVVHTGDLPVDSQLSPHMETSSSTAAALATRAEKNTPRPAHFADATEDIPSPTSRLIDTESNWSSVIKPFLMDNVGWFVGVFLVITGFIILILSFWSSIEQNQILMHSLVYFSLASATALFFKLAYFIRRKYPQLESSSNVLLVLVALLIPLVFAAATLTSLVPVSSPNPALIEKLR